MTSFIPDFKAPQTATPWFEDSSKLEIPGRGTQKSTEKLQQEIAAILGKMGAFAIYYTSGQFPGKPTRFGYRVHFQWANAAGRIDIAALPMKHETPDKKQKALAQALYLFRDKVQADFYASMYEPGGLPLIAYLLDNNGKTVTEALIESGNLPLLKSGAA